jgi:tRNA A37 N6-isopentenylltransferase MiaA
MLHLQQNVAQRFYTVNKTGLYNEVKQVATIQTIYSSKHVIWQVSYKELLKKQITGPSVLAPAEN